MATDRAWTGKDGERHEQTEWHNVIFWGTANQKPSNLVEYMVSGREVLVEGRIQTRSWEKDGNKHYRTEIIAERVTLVGQKPTGVGGQQGGEHREQNRRQQPRARTRQPDTAAAPPLGTELTENDIPF